MRRMISMAKRTVTRKMIAAGTLAALFSVTPAHAGNAITISNVSHAGGTVTVAGSISYEDVGYAELGAEAVGDDLLRGTAGIGGDLQGFALGFDRVTNRLRIRWKSNYLQLAGQASASGHVTGATFAVAGRDSYEVASSMIQYPNPPITGPGTRFWKCSAPGDCSQREGGGTSVISPYYSLEGFIYANIPGVVQDGDRITPVSLGKGSVYIGAGLFANHSLTDSTRLYDPYVSDWLDEEYEVFTAGLRLDAIVGAPGLDPAALDYASRIALGAGDSFTATMEAAPGQSIYLRACHATTCFYATTDVPE